MVALGHHANWGRETSVIAITLMMTAVARTEQDPAEAVSQTTPSRDIADTNPQDTSRITDEYIPLFDASTMPRPRPLLEIGNPFQSAGPLDPGFEVPGGAVWQPSLTVFGTYRTSLQVFDNGTETFSEWANRLDLYANLQLTGTERILAGIRPLDQRGRFTGYEFNPNREDGWVNEFNATLTTLFFEGDLAELLPDLDPREQRGLDWGFSVGRQPLFIQEGMLINDDIDAVGITRNTIFPKGGSNLRLTFLYGWNEIDRDDNREGDSTHLFGLFTESDWPNRTVALDVVYILDDDNETDGVFWGASTVQRFGHLNTAFRLLGSNALHDESDAVSDGYLLFGEISWTPKRTDDVAYVNAFWGIDNFASAARGPSTGGPLGRTGILFSAVGLGRYGAALGNRADESAGGAIGYQMFSTDHRRQLIVEFGGRRGTDGEDGTLALGARYRHALGQRTVLQLDAFGAFQSDDDAFGLRAELRYEF